MEFWKEDGNLKRWWCFKYKRELWEKMSVWGSSVSYREKDVRSQELCPKEQSNNSVAG